MPTVVEQSLESPDVSNKAELTLADVYDESDKAVAESARDLKAYEDSLWHEFYDNVRAELERLDPQNDHADMSDQDVAKFLKEDRFLAPRIETILDRENRGRHELSGSFQERWAREASENTDIIDRLLPIVVDAFGAELAVPLGEYVNRYHLEEAERTEFLASLTREAYRLRDLGRADARARETAARIFAAIMEPDVRETCREWVGKDGRARLDGRSYTVEDIGSS